ncbi:MAG: VOC family protein [Leptolyngbyaceae cyanobacterium]
MKRSPVTPSLYVPDISTTLDFDVSSLGFAQTAAYKGEDGAAIWAEVALNEARIWFFTGALETQPGPAFSGLIYIFVPDVDALATSLEGKVPFEWGPETQEYGLREVGIRDVNGYYLVFAQDV